jgi:hypothetical protein
LSKYDYYTNPQVLSAIGLHLRHIKNDSDREDFRQEIFANLYDFMPIETNETIRLIDKVAMRFRREYIDQNKGDCEHKGDAYIYLGDGNYQKKAHMGASD